MAVKYSLIIAFILIISLPTLLIGFRTKDTANFENRAKQDFPELSLKHPFRTFKKVDAFYKDNFMFRNELSNFYFKLKEDYFKTDPLPEKVITGKEGWLFLGDNYSNVFSESIGVSPVSEKEVAKAAAKIIEMRDFCDSKGIKFYFAVAPNKESFYTEYLPIAPNNKPRKVDLLKDHLQKQYNFNLIDLKEYLEPQKNKVRLFHKTDTHWNEYGGFLGTQKLVDDISKDFPLRKLSITEYAIDTFTTYQMDLAKILKKEIPEQRFRFTSPTLQQVKLDTIPVENQQATFLVKSKSSNGKGLKSLVFRDSFFNWMLAYFSTSIENSTFIRKSFDKKLIDKEKPDFVIVQIVERNL